MGWFSDLVDSAVQAGAQEGTRAIQAKAAQESSKGTSAHIDAQNQAVANFGTIVDAFNRSSLSTADAINRINAIDNTFTTFCQRLNYARALQGARDVHGLALNVVADFQNRAAQNTYQGPDVFSSGGITLPGGVLSAGPSTVSWGTVGLLAVAAYVMFQQKRSF